MLCFAMTQTEIFPKFIVGVLYPYSVKNKIISLAINREECELNYVQFENVHLLGVGTVH